jgi:uncharacterized protein
MDSVGVGLGMSDGQGGTPRHVDPDVTADQRTYALFMHLSLILANVAIPIVPALILWLIKRKESAFLDDHGREALNFQISLLIYFCVSLVLVMACFVGVIGIAAVYVLGIVGMVMAASAANRGEYYRYPATLRLIT